MRAYPLWCMSNQTQKQWQSLLNEVKFNVGREDRDVIAIAEQNLIDSLYYYIDEEDRSSSDPKYMDGSVDVLCIIDSRWQEYSQKYPFHIAIRMLQSSIQAMRYCYKNYFNDDSEYKKGFINTLVNAEKYFNTWQFNDAFAAYMQKYKRRSP